MRQSLLYLFVLLFMISCGSKQQEKSTPSQSQASPSAQTDQSQSMSEAQYVEQATFTDLEGNEVSLSKYQGKVVLIDFWETWCKPCIASFSTMQQLMDDYPDRFVVLAVTPGFTNTKEDARQFAQNHDYDFVYLYDENKLHQKLNVRGIPFKVFVGPEGKFIESSLGSQGPKGDYQHAKKIIEEHSDGDA